MGVVHATNSQGRGQGRLRPSWTNAIKKEQGKCCTRKKKKHWGKHSKQREREDFFLCFHGFYLDMFSLSRDNLRHYGNIQKRDIYSAHIYPSTSVISFSFHVLLALWDLVDLSILSVRLPYHLSMCVLSTESNKWTQKPNSFILPKFGHIFQHHLAKYLPCAITELPPTLQRSHVEVRIPIFIALGLKSLCRSH